AQLIRATAKQVGDNRDGVAVNKAGIETNADAIAQNKTAIDDNTHEIDTNAQLIRATAKQVGDNRDGIAVNKAGIETNADAIAQNKTAIDDNTHEIDTNADAIAQNKTAIDDNTHEIDTNAQLIRSTEKQVGENRTGLLANKGDIVTTATGVMSNAADIATNKTSIDRLSGQNGTTFKLAAATARLSIHEEQQIVTLAQDTKVAQTTGEYAQSRAQMALDNAEKNRAALVASNKKIAANSAALADHEQRIETLEQSNSSNFGKLKSEVEDNRKRASAGIAGVAAMANIPQVTNTQNFSVGAGVGNTDGENALAVGFSARATKNVVVKASVSNDTQHNFVVGGGIAYGW
ncbi:YadA C-terminal domain-containing protein, partial [Enterobacter asburiae]|uniref:YadA C-terminal domain-containing protein n=1 Tax=Enterobacter asburiae TaxID=61645 RepID=UPI001F3AFFB5